MSGGGIGRLARLVFILFDCLDCNRIPQRILSRRILSFFSFYFLVLSILVEMHSFV